MVAGAKVVDPGGLINYLPVYNVLLYGAKGDNATDDTTAINNCITAAAGKGIVYFPPPPGGSYRISTIALPDQTRLMGATSASTNTPFGHGQSLIARLVNTTSSLFTIPTSHQNIVIEDLAFNGNVTTNATGYAYGDLIHFDDDSVATDPIQHTYINRCYFYNSAGNGIYVGNNRRDIHVTNTTIQNIRPITWSSAYTAYPAGLIVGNGTPSNTHSCAFVNLTGTATTTAPGSDTTNWLEITSPMEIYPVVWASGTFTKGTLVRDNSATYILISATGTYTTAPHSDSTNWLPIVGSFMFDGLASAGGTDSYMTDCLIGNQLFGNGVNLGQGLAGSSIWNVTNVACFGNIVGFQLGTYCTGARLVGCEADRNAKQGILYGDDVTTNTSSSAVNTILGCTLNINSQYADNTYSHIRVGSKIVQASISANSFVVAGTTSNTPSYCIEATGSGTTVYGNVGVMSPAVGSYAQAAHAFSNLGNALVLSSAAAQTPVNVNPVNTVAVSSNAGTCSALYAINNFTNSSAATMAITLSTTGAVDGQEMIVRVYDFSAASQTIGWTNTENSGVSAPTTSNGSTTLPSTVTFQYNSATSKWRCIQSC